MLAVAVTGLVLCTGTGIRAKAADNLIDYGTQTGLNKEVQHPYVEYAGVDHYPVLKGDKVTINMSAKYDGDYSDYSDYDNVQYRVFITNADKEEYVEITNGYSEAIEAPKSFTISYDKSLDAGNYKVMVLVKQSKADGTTKGKYGNYDNVYYFNFTCFESAPSENAASIGVTPGNAANDGMAVEDDNYIYYINRSGDIYGTSPDYIYKIKKNSAPRKDLCDLKYNTKLIDDRVWNLNLVGDWIYYSNWIDPFHHGIYKVKTDGTGKTCIANEAVGNMIVKGNWIYYVKRTNSHSIMENNVYKMSVDGSCRIKLNDDAVEDMTVCGDWIYYSNESDGYKPYRIKTDGTSRSKICDDETLFMTAVDNTVYYSNNSDREKLYAINGDGSGKRKIVNDRISFINAENDSIYYVNESDGSTLYKVNSKGENRKKLSKDSGSTITVLKDKIYFNDLFFDIKE